jgi:hypothetical protein
VPLSRYHLFYRIHLNHSNVSAFVALLKSESGSSIGAFVQQVAIYREQSHPPWMKEILPVLSSSLHPTSLFLNIQNSFQGDSAFFESQEFQLYREDLSVFRDVSAAEPLAELQLIRGGSPFFLWLLRQPHPPLVSSLSLRDTYVTETVKSYLQTLGGTLRHLSFEPNFHQSTSNLIDVSHNVGLRSIFPNRHYLNCIPVALASSFHRH